MTFLGRDEIGAAVAPGCRTGVHHLYRSGHRCRASKHWRRYRALAIPLAAAGRVLDYYRSYHHRGAFQHAADIG